MRYFLAVVEHGSINAAAAAVGVSQPTISQALRGFERDLKTPLFHRIGRGMVPTSAGHALVSPVRRLLRDLSSSAGLVSDPSGELHGSLSLYCHPSVASGVFSQVVAEFHRKHPAVKISIKPVEAGAEIAQLLRGAECDLVVAHLAEQQQSDVDLQTLKLGAQVYDLALPPEFPGPSRAVMRRADIDLPSVVVPERSAHASQLFAASSPGQQARRPAALLENREARLSFVLAGVGVSWIERSQAEVAVQHGARIREVEPRLEADFGLFFVADRLSIAAQEFVSLAREVSSRSTSKNP